MIDPLLDDDALTLLMSEARFEVLKIPQVLQRSPSVTVGTQLLIGSHTHIMQKMLPTSAAASKRLAEPMEHVTVPTKDLHVVR